MSDLNHRVMNTSKLLERQGVSTDYFQLLAQT